MKNKIYSLIVMSATASICGCVNVDNEIAQTPSVYWKPSKDSMPEQYYAPSQIKTDKIESAKVSTDELSEEIQEDTPLNKSLTSSERMLSGKQLNLLDLIDIALENNPTTRIYWFQAKRYAASVGKANAAYYPQLSIGAEVYTSKTKVDFYNIGAYYDNAFGPSASISWLLYDFGKRQAQVDAAKEAMRAANFEYNQVIQDVFLNVNLGYFEYFAAVNSVQTAKLNIKDAQTSYDSANVKLENNVGNKQDMLNALASLRSAEYELENKIASVEIARSNLAVALGVSARDIKNISVDMQISHNNQASKDIDALIVNALKSRQSLLAGYAQLRNAQEEVKIAQRNYYPDLVTEGSAYYFKTFDDDSTYQYKIGLGLSWEIFDGFTRKYELISAKAQERQMAQQLKATQIQIISDVWAFYHVYQSALKQIDSAKATVEASFEAYNATKIGFDNGVNTITDLLDSQNRLASARQVNVNAEANLSSSIAKLSHAVGAMTSKTQGSE